MSAAAAAEVGAPPSKGKKKLLLMIVGAALLLVLAGGGGVLYLKKQAADRAAAEGEDGETSAEAGADHDKAPPAYVPLEMFTVNLADRDAERYAQIGITLEIEDPKVADQLKLYMPAIRNNILMVLAHKTADELLERDGKRKLAAEVMRETVRPLGVKIEIPEEEAAPSQAEGEGEPTKKPKKKGPPSPVKAVYFSNFIIQ